jgi:rod shape-determining protein MreD
MIRSIIWTVVFSIIAAVLQSTVITYLVAKIYFFHDAKPDIVLCILVFSAYVNGTMTGQVSGFLSGLFTDLCFSQAPIGMSSIIRTIIGALTGIFKDSLFLGYVIMPIVLCSIATLLKALMMFVLHLFMNTIPTYSFTDSRLWIELGLNAICAPLLFLLLRNFKPMLIGRS